MGQELQEPYQMKLLTSKKSFEDQSNLNSKILDQRYLAIIIFFQKYIPTSVAEVINIEVVNKLFNKIEYHADIHAQYFNVEVENTTKETDGLLNHVKKIATSIVDTKKRISSMLNMVENTAKKPLPLIKQLPPKFYEDGIKSLESTVNVRGIIASKHWFGETDYSVYDLMQEIIPQLE